MPPPLPPALFAFIVNRFKSIFYEPTSWAEATSALGALMYCVLLIGGYVLGDKDPQLFASLRLVITAIPVELWFTICCAVVAFKIATVISGLRTLRLAGAIVMLFWLSAVIFLTWAVSPWAPLLGFPIGLCFFNIFAIARHVRDWEFPIKGA